MNPIFTHPGQEQMQVEVILASKGPDQRPIYTIRMRYPRIIHGEIMTHRVFSRNARSSRAVPVKTMLNEVQNTPFVPWHWGKNQGGMQAGEECNEELTIPEHYDWEGYNVIREQYFSREDIWLEARDHAVEVASAYMEAGYHKQIPNRLLEPFSWIDTLVTSTEWDNFLWLRDHSDAEPHLQDLARLIKQAIDNASALPLEPGDWHLPYINLHDRDHANSICGIREDDPDLYLCKISAARCARISYKPFDGDASYERELERYNSLVTADRVHASPLEHQATPDEIYTGNERCINECLPDDWHCPNMHGNLTGYIQYRKTIPNEAKMEGIL